MNTEQRHWILPQQLNTIRKLGRGQLHVVWGLTGTNSFPTKTYLQQRITLPQRGLGKLKLTQSAHI